MVQFIIHKPKQKDARLNEKKKTYDRQSVEEEKKRGEKRTRVVKNIEAYIKTGNAELLPKEEEIHDLTEKNLRECFGKLKKSNRFQNSKFLKSPQQNGKPGKLSNWCCHYTGK